MPEQLTALRSLDPSDVVAHLDEMPGHEIRLFANLTPADLEDCLALTPPARPVVALDLHAERSTDHCIEAALRQIAVALAQLWPLLWNGEDFSDWRDDALGLAHLPIRLAALADRLPSLRPSLACDLVLRLMRNRSPRLRNVEAGIEWAQLTLAFAPAGLILAVRLDADRYAPARIRALEWLAQHANVGVAVLTDGAADADAFERVAYASRYVARRTTDEAFAIPCDDQAPLVLALPPAPEGRPHPMSPIEQKLYRLIQGDDELRPLFVFNKTVRLSLLVARIDLVWLDGRVAVEIDGHEHRAAAMFRADRHRDYELMCAGYRVLRMTNDDVETDAALAIEKIRTVARLARMEGR